VIQILDCPARSLVAQLRYPSL